MTTTARDEHELHGEAAVGTTTACDEHDLHGEAAA
jgi:hypothetical protein